MDKKSLPPVLTVEAIAAREQGDERRQDRPEIKGEQVRDEDADQIDAARVADGERAEKRETGEREADERPDTEQDKNCA